MTTLASIVLYMLAMLFAAGSAATLQQSKGNKAKTKEARPGVVVTFVLLIIAIALQVTA